MITKIAFKNYKSFKERQELEIKPITVLIGKNSSGKSAIAKLLALVENSLRGDSEYPLKITGYDNGIELGAVFEDLIYGRSRTGKLELEISDSNNNKLEIIIGTEKEVPKIFSWTFNGVEKIGFDNVFRGFRLESNEKELQINDLSYNIDYIGPFRMVPPRELSGINANVEVKKLGYEGEGAYSLLLQDGLTTQRYLISRVSKWYQKSFENWGIYLNKDKDPFSQIELYRKDDSIYINLADVGQGMSQALPLVVKAMMPVQMDEIAIIEQPELHLHPAAHGNLAELFVESLAEKNRHYFIETHSQNFVLRLRRLIAEKKYSWFNAENLAIYFVDFDDKNNTSCLKPIKIDNNGYVDFWPGNIFNEALDEAIALREAQEEGEHYEN
ncbi:DUF3696 domain-containing protein [Mucilaginibacter sp. 22184]|uniref:DUF3696 domain-containing protein n=1 Tax=Mucilaginibacter sp. 22184 TaxID=3453887 RepID=UPI003F826D72